mgnify:CR=1 FL=1
MGTTLRGENKELFSKSAFHVRQWFERALAQEGKSKTHNKSSSRTKNNRNLKNFRQKVRVRNPGVKLFGKRKSFENHV